MARFILFALALSFWGFTATEALAESHTDHIA